MLGLIKTRLLLIATLFIQTAYSQPIYKIWDNALQGNYRDGSFLEMIRTSGNNLLVACLSASDSGYDKTMELYLNNTFTEPWILMLDQNGNKIWDRDFYGAEATRGITQLNDSTFVLLCFIAGGGGAIGSDVSAPVTGNIGGPGCWIVAFDSLGNKYWDKQFDPGVDTIQNVNHIILPYDVKAVGGKIYITGRAATIPNFYGGDLTAVNCPNYPSNAAGQAVHNALDHTDMLLYEVTPGDSLTNTWQQLYGGDSVEIPTTIFPIGSDGFLIGGITSSQASCNQTVSSYIYPYYDFYVVRTNPVGNIIWQERYGGSKNDWLNGIVDAGNGNFLLFGRTLSPMSFDVSSNGYNDTSLWMIKIDGSGNIIWDKRYGACNGFSIKGNEGGGVNNEYCSNTVGGIRTFDGGYLFVSNVTNSSPCGDVSEPGQGLEDYWMLKLDSAGNKVWDKRFGGPGIDVPEQVVEMSPGYYIVAGYTRGLNAAQQAAGGDKSEVTIGTMDIWLIGVADSAAILAAVNNIEESKVELKMYPNPSNISITLAISKGEGNNYYLNIYDVTGKKQFNRQIGSAANINISNLKEGMYIVEVKDEKGHFARRKLVKN